MEFTNNEESTVDLIQSADVDVKTVAEVVKKTKARTVNLSTTVNTLKTITKEELEQVPPGVIRDLLIEANRINSEYKDILAGT